MSSTFGSSVPYAEPIWYSRGLSLDYDSSHERLRSAIREYVDTSIAPHVEEWEKKGSIPPEVYQRHADLGYVAAAIYPMSKENIGGVTLPGNVPAESWNAFHDLILMDEIARIGYLGVIWGLGCGNVIGCPPLINHGTPEQKQKFLPPVFRGRSRFCLGITEPDAGSDVANITTVAERKGDKYIINGAKKWITNGIWADYCAAAVRTGGPGRKGVSALIIPLKEKGVMCRKMENSGVSASGSTYIEFDDVEVPVSNLLGKENEGFDIIMTNFNHERLWLACISLRLSRVCVRDAYEHAQSRETFNKPLLSNQLIRFKLADIGGKIEPVYAFLEQLVRLISDSAKAGVDNALSGEIALLKVMAGQTLEKTVRESQQIFGGLGYSRNGKGAKVEQISRDVRVMVVGGGSEEILMDLALKQEERALKKLGGKKAKL
ncbi:hypothetical protein EG329_004595 [Mollisiaceae sp. DMI_Dod_QoI]|nr:hypothetical protein EG329_004595 [Helotiales sp. DMI_Dod_QoI]